MGVRCSSFDGKGNAALATTGRSHSRQSANHATVEIGQHLEVEGPAGLMVTASAIGRASVDLDTNRC